MINLILAKEVPYFQFITAQFAGSQQHYTYKTSLPAIKEGDFIVVDSPSGLTVVTVTATNVEVKPSPKYAIKWVMGRVDTPYYKGLLALENAIIERTAESEDGTKRL